MKIEFDKYCLRPYRDLDVKSLAKYANNKKIWKNLRDGFPHPYSEENAREWIAITKKNREGLTLAICLEDQAIGNVGISLGVDVHFRTAELGYWLGEEYWGQGIMQNAVRLYVDFVFEEFNLLRVFAEPFEHNVASCRLLEKAGFNLEGKLENNAVKNGVVLDVMMYAKIRSEQGSGGNG